MSINIQGAMKRFSGAVIRPVLFLAVAGILLAVSVILRMEGMPGPLVALGTLIYTCINSGVVGNLGILFCIGIACALANKKKGDAAVIAAATFLVFLYADNLWLSMNNMLVDPATGLYGTGQQNVLGVQVVDMGVFIGIILGCINGWVFNKYCDVKFPEVVSCYGGTRFVFFVAITISAVLGIAMCYIWPVVNGWINTLQGFMSATGYAGMFVYGFLNKLLIPTGMHHLLWMPYHVHLCWWNRADSRSSILWFVQHLHG
jgi:PTS system arbutin-like IIC component